MKSAYALTIFLSALLLFQVELIVGKELLPWFGGAPAVWTTCLVFFQVVLLGGYAYAHLIVSRIPLKGQVSLHLGLVALSVVLLLFLALRWPASIIPGANLEASCQKINHAVEVGVADRPRTNLQAVPRTQHIDHVRAVNLTIIQQDLYAI